jgi:hypothetical protein
MTGTKRNQRIAVVLDPDTGKLQAAFGFIDNAHFVALERGKDSLLYDQFDAVVCDQFFKRSNDPLLPVKVRF